MPDSTPDITDNSLHHLPVDHPPVKQGKIGLLIINLGTPDAPTASALRRYLAEFLSDKRVVELPRLIWMPVLYGPILTFRPPKVAKLYKKIWDEEHNDSPLRVFTKQQAEGLAEKMRASYGGDVIVDFAMRYGNPSIESRIDALQEQGCTRIITLALYPHYSASTTASSYDKVFDVLQKKRWQPALRTVPAFHDDPVYIDVLAKSVEAHLTKLDWQPEVILASYHGIPQRYFKAGDPYHCHCAKTTRLLRERLGLTKDQLRFSFQSRFGPEPWLQPYTDETLEELAKDGVKNIAVLTPGFFSDCLETLEEIAMEGRESFIENGGENFSFIPCLNGSDGAITLLDHLARRELQGWI